MIRISEPMIGEPEEQLVLEVLRSGRLVQGPMVARFEEAARDVVDAAEDVAVNNGTNALVASLLAHGIGPGDEVVTSPLTFVATLNAILQVLATPRFTDIGPDFNMDPASLADLVGPATRAVMPVHLYGLPCELDAIRTLAHDTGAVVVEDAAQALGASVGEAHVGATGTSCFSFYRDELS